MDERTTISETDEITETELATDDLEGLGGPFSPRFGGTTTACRQLGPSDAARVATSKARGWW